MTHPITTSRESIAQTQREASAVLKSSQAFLDRDKGTGSVLSKIQDRLLAETDVVTSQDTGAEALFGEAVAGLEEALEVGQTGIAAKAERLRGEEIEFGESAALGALEGRQGFATQTAILRNIKDDTEKDLRQIDLWEQEALAAGRTEIATKLAEIKLQKIQFLQEAKQRAFSNLLGLGNLAVNIETSERLTQQAEFDQMTQKLNFLSENQLLGDLSGNDRRNLEVQFGLPTGVLDRLSTQQPMNLRVVDGVGLVNTYRDKSGKIVADTIVPEIVKSTESARTSERLSRTAVQLSQSAGEDNLVSAQGYLNAERTWVNMGGTRREFVSEFPPELYLNEEEQTRIPSTFLTPDEDTDIESILRFLETPEGG